MQGSPALSPYVGQPNRLGVVESPQIPQLTPQRIASATAQTSFDPEEAMESDSQAGSGSERQ